MHVHTQKKISSLFALQVYKSLEEVLLRYEAHMLAAVKDCTRQWGKCFNIFHIAPMLISVDVL